MIRVRSRSPRLVAAVLAFGLLGAACGSPNGSAEGGVEETTTTTIAKGPDTTAAQLRSRLNGLLEEYVYLGTAANGAALGQRVDEFLAAGAAFRSNATALTANVSAIFGDSVGKTFEPLWRRHAELFIEYARALGQHDGAASAKALSDLTQYTKDFGVFINSNLPALPADIVTSVAATAVQTFKAVIDAQAAGNEPEVYTNARKAADQITVMGSALVGAIAKQFPERIGGDPASKAADLVTTLNGALREHVFLAAAATDGALGGRAEEFTGAKAALDTNSDAVSAAIGSVYGPQAGSAFAPLWKKHIDFLVDYTTGVAAKDQAKADQAMKNLLAYTEEFGAFINSASPKLTKEAVADLVKTHVLTLKDVIDAQAAKNFSKAYTNIRTAADHMAMIANGLATTIVAQFPDKF